MIKELTQQVDELKPLAEEGRQAARYKKRGEIAAKYNADLKTLNDLLGELDATEEYVERLAKHIGGTAVAGNGHEESPKEPVTKTVPGGVAAGRNLNQMSTEQRVAKAFDKLQKGG